ncbi:MAG TPA: lamin tail domain-containing protein [Candidatus Paceibacterota bacterium]
MRKTKLFFVPLVLAALFVWTGVPTTGQAVERSERPDRPDRSAPAAAQEEITLHTTNHSSKKFGGALCNVFSSHPFFMWLTPFSWCGTPEPEPEPEPEPDVDHLLITEVYYDVDDAHGTETANEWVEIYNSTGADIDLTGWTIEDANGSADSLGTSTIPTGGFAIIAEDDTTATFWAWPAETVVILVGATIGNALGNAGDALYLKNSLEEIVDSVSWDSSTAAFDPSVPGVPEGSSIARDPLTTDTNTAADWIELETPNPGE